ncbi:MAG: UbiD family decarboxylase [Desulfovibrionaceae bacterium]|nr:UbiD family decarboxylase [Desulfovibrionaceae bacterium]
MAWSSLARCVKDLEQAGQLRRIEVELDPYLEIAAVQRRVFAAKGPALLFTNVRGTPFPMVANLFGTMDRLYYIFRNEIPLIRRFLDQAGGIASFFEHPFKNVRNIVSMAGRLLTMGTRSMRARSAPVLANTCTKADLPHLVSWPLDGGAFITLPLVYSEDPASPGLSSSNLGMYRIQLSGNKHTESEMGVHYQIHRGLGVHHAHALARGIPLPVTVYVGGPPALTIAAVMPLPEGISELRFAGLLGGQGVSLTKTSDAGLPILCDADFCIQGVLGPVVKPEGPFGDHVGYYSLQHDFPVLSVRKITHRTNAIWPFTTVGRPPQEDSVLGAFIHELTAPFVSRVFPGIRAVHAVDAAGVHPLLLALADDRYTPYAATRKPRELLTQALHLLGNTQTALAKYLLIAAREDVSLSVADVPGFLRHVLERTDFSTDLHFLAAMPGDTLDYTGTDLNEGSKLIWAVAGEKRRTLGSEYLDLPALPRIPRAALAGQGILVLEGPLHNCPRGEQDPELFVLCDMLAEWEGASQFPLVVLVDNLARATASFENFLWITFTRSDPACDCYGGRECVRAKKWSCQAPLLIDARKKAFHPAPLVEDSVTTEHINQLAGPGGPLAGLW